MYTLSPSFSAGGRTRPPPRHHRQHSTSIYCHRTYVLYALPHKPPPPRFQRTPCTTPHTVSAACRPPPSCRQRPPDVMAGPSRRRSRRATPPSSQRYVFPPRVQRRPSMHIEHQNGASVRPRCWHRGPTEGASPAGFGGPVRWARPRFSAGDPRGLLPEGYVLEENLVPLNPATRSARSLVQSGRPSSSSRVLTPVWERTLQGACGRGACVRARERAPVHKPGPLRPTHSALSLVVADCQPGHVVEYGI